MHTAAQALTLTESATGRALLYRPAPPLDQLIESFWVADDYVAPTAKERVLPSGAPALVIHLVERPMRLFGDTASGEWKDASGAVLCGARRTPLVIGTALGPTVGVHFKPGGARPFFDVPADAVAEQVVSLDALWGSTAGALRLRLMETSCFVERVRVVQSMLLEKARRSIEPKPALSSSLRAFEERELHSVAEVNRRTGMSPKRLLALFREEVGLSPKAFWRVRRFRAALRDLECGALRGADLAGEHGYCDQAHFLREFRAFSGSSPREYLAARVPGSDHVSVYG